MTWSARRLAGEVLEIGFGTGLNLPHMPPTVSRLIAVDPLERGRGLASERLAATHVDVDFVGLDGQSLDVADDAVDAALSTWTLCSIPDAAAGGPRDRPVLRPGGTFHFVEHGRAPDAEGPPWQARLTACRAGRLRVPLDRDIPALIEAGGMTVTSPSTRPSCRVSRRSSAGRSAHRPGRRRTTP